MTKLGLFFAKRFINRSELSRETGINVNRLTKLCLNENSKLTAEELYKISEALKVNATELLVELYRK